MKNYFLPASKTALVLVYLVIIAGAVVRMTGSGMGCPDWPKCFGYYIPPTEKSELLFTPDKTYNKGMVIIKDESLLVAKSDFTTGKNFSNSNWEKYTKHDYAIFNPLHTWVEYINRLFGALAGLACLIVAILSISYRTKNKKITLFSWIVVFMMGFQAWLGKTVVDSVLSPFKITTHMIVALLIVALILYIIKNSSVKEAKTTYHKKFNTYVWFAILLSILQIIMGTQVRQNVDHEIKNGVTASILWLQSPTLWFYFHRSFSIIILFLNLYLFYLNKKLKLKFNILNWVIVLIGFEILTGIAMYYFDFPFASQPIHLTIASILFGVQFYLVLQTLEPKINK